MSNDLPESVPGSPKYTEVRVTCADRDEARRIGQHLLDERLVVATHLFDVESRYWWRDALVANQEVVLTAISRADLFERIVVTVKTQHRYEVPAITMLELLGSSADYLAWIEANLTA
jgi:periplasmic divalent cation tolerance protein